MTTSGLARVTALLAALAPAACNLSTEPDRPARVEILDFRIERAEPPGAVVDGALAVEAGARLTFAIAVDGPVERLVLSAGDVVLAELPPDASTFVDDCAAAPCGTAVAGRILYTLSAVGPGDDPSTDARSLLVQVGESAAPLRYKR